MKRKNYGSEGEAKARALVRTQTATLVLRWLSASGLNRKAFAAKVGLSPSYLSRLLNGRVNATVSTLARMAFALGLTLRLGLGSETTPEPDWLTYYYPLAA